MTAPKAPDQLQKRGPKGPSKYNQEMVDKLETFGSNGEGVAEACLMLGIAKETFYDWSRKFPEFSDATKKFRLNSQVWWENMGRQGACGEINKFNAISFIFNMKNRFPDDWRDKVDVVSAVSVSIAKDHADL